MTDYPTCCHACGRARDSKAERKWRKAIREENDKWRSVLERTCVALGMSAPPPCGEGLNIFRMSVDEIAEALDAKFAPTRMGDIGFAPVQEGER